jgi:hypothetical protein
MRCAVPAFYIWLKALPLMFIFITISAGSDFEPWWVIGLVIVGVVTCPFILPVALIIFAARRIGYGSNEKAWWVAFCICLSVMMCSAALVFAMGGNPGSEFWNFSLSAFFAVALATRLTKRTLYRYFET